MSLEYIDIFLKNKADNYISGILHHVNTQNYYEALACYKMAKSIVADFDKEDRFVWSKMLYGLSTYFTNVPDCDNAIYCLDRATDICPEWDEIHYARSRIIRSPLAHNSQANVDRLYSNPRVVEEYLSVERINFYAVFFDTCIRQEISFDDKDIVDVGCGPGLLLQIISDRSNPKSISGFDFSAEAIKVAKHNCPVGMCSQFDIYSSCAKNFDVVLCTETLEHLLYPEEAMQNVIELIRPMGQLVVGVPNGRLDTFEGHINFWSPESWNIFIERTCTNLPYISILMDGKHNIAIIKRPC